MFNLGHIIKLLRNQAREIEWRAQHILSLRWQGKKTKRASATLLRRIQTLRELLDTLEQALNEEEDE